MNLKTTEYWGWVTVSWRLAIFWMHNIKFFVHLESFQWIRRGMSGLRFLPEPPPPPPFFFCIFRVENIAFSSANSRLISSMQIFFFLSLCPSLIRSEGRRNTILKDHMALSLSCTWIVLLIAYVQINLKRNLHWAIDRVCPFVLITSRPKGPLEEEKNLFELCSSPFLYQLCTLSEQPYKKSAFGKKKRGLVHLFVCVGPL